MADIRRYIDSVDCSAILLKGMQHLDGLALSVTPGRVRTFVVLYDPSKTLPGCILPLCTMMPFKKDLSMVGSVPATHDYSPLLSILIRPRNPPGRHP
ncbi:hypothetical protein IGS68_00840 [Skermanella sp. TT6]|uniref:Uncharacterized protein n=1 Tax=Skermanella cutis TaxID=2775420 RepID=A0ABX7B648_9PROT|nr:hypothetical protein [Skermanella sp. TT6]QQP89860.1 hypothetical protein IGS68_00840 [Skermanella sp. TT6]